MICIASFDYWHYGVHLTAPSQPPTLAYWEKAAPPRALCVTKQFPARQGWEFMPKMVRCPAIQSITEPAGRPVKAGTSPVTLATSPRRIDCSMDNICSMEVADTPAAR